MKKNTALFGTALAALLALTRGAAAAKPDDFCIQENNVVNLISTPDGDNAIAMDFYNKSRHALWCEYIFVGGDGKPVASATFALPANGESHAKARAKGVAAAQPTQACYLAEPPASAGIANTCLKNWAAKSAK